nr:MAG TPA: hypothetical protein [Caudoviricetes sp.]
MSKHTCLQFQSNHSRARMQRKMCKSLNRRTFR